MRTIKFRGKRVDTKEWIYGDLCVAQMDGKAAISTNSIGLFVVIPETVGQFTGLILDEGLTPIFEGDIISGHGAYVLWDNELCCWCFNFPFSKTPNVPLFYNDTIQTMKWVGTIHD